MKARGQNKILLNSIFYSLKMFYALVFISHENIWVSIINVFTDKIVYFVLHNDNFL